MTRTDITAWLHANKNKFGRYFVVGITGLIMDVGLLYIASEWFHLPPTHALFGTQIVVIAYVFFMNRQWSFQSAGAKHRQFIKFLIVLGFNYLIGVSAMYLGHDKLGIHYEIVRVTTVALSVSWNFLLYNYWVYRD